MDIQFILVWLLSQVAILLFTLFSAKQEAPVVKAFRDYVPTGNQYEKPFHVNGWMMTLIFSLAISLPQLFIGKFIHFILMGLSACLIYWAYFDRWLNIFTGKPKDYIGQTSFWDKKLNKLFGKRAGQIKFIMCNVIDTSVFIAATFLN